MRRGSERCTIGTGRANVVSFAAGPVARPVRLVGWAVLRAARPRAVGSALETSTHVHAPSIEHTPSIEATPTPTPRSNPLPLSPPPRNREPSRITRLRAPSPARGCEHRLVGALARVGGVRRVYPHAPHHQQRRLPRAVRRRHFLHGHARRLERSSDRVATEAGAVFAPIPRAVVFAPIPVSAPARVAADGDAWLAPVPLVSLRSAAGLEYSRRNSRDTPPRAREPSPRGRRGWATTARGTPTGTRGQNEPTPRARASPGERVQGLFAPADDLDALHGVPGDDAHGADRLRGGDCGDFGGREGRVRICGSEEYSASFR